MRGPGSDATLAVNTALHCESKLLDFTLGDCVYDRHCIFFDAFNEASTSRILYCAVRIFDKRRTLLAVCSPSRTVWTRGQRCFLRTVCDFGWLVHSGTSACSCCTCTRAPAFSLALRRFCVCCRSVHLLVLAVDSAIRLTGRSRHMRSHGQFFSTERPHVPGPRQPVRKVNTKAELNKDSSGTLFFGLMLLDGP